MSDQTSSTSSWHLLSGRKTCPVILKMLKTAVCVCVCLCDDLFVAYAVQIFLLVVRFSFRLILRAFLFTFDKWILSWPFIFSSFFIQIIFMKFL